jgi:hypothetical protein
MHVSRICDVLACIGDRLNVIMDQVGAVIVKFVELLSEYYLAMNA